MSKEKIELEYLINCSPKVLFNRLSTASGLAEWFADDVSVNGKKFTFFWEDAENVKHSNVEIVASEMMVLGEKRDNTQPTNDLQENNYQTDDEYPF